MKHGIINYRYFCHSPCDEWYLLHDHWATIYSSTYVLYLPIRVYGHVCVHQESTRLAAMELAVAEAAKEELVFEQIAAEQLEKQADAEDDERRWVHVAWRMSTSIND